MILLGGLIICCTLFFLLRFEWKRKRTALLLPPGPPTMPIFGNLLQIDRKDPRKTFLQWHKKYGSMYTVWLGWHPQVFITGYDLMRDLFVKRGTEFQDRPTDWIWEYAAKGKYGIISGFGEPMHVQRQTTVQILRKFVFDRTTIEEIVMIEIEKLIHRIEIRIQDLQRNVINVTIDIDLCIGNIISLLLFGRIYDETDLSFHQLKSNVEQHYKNLFKLNIRLLKSFPFLQYIPFYKKLGFKNMVDEKRHILTTFTNEVKRCKNEQDKMSEPKNFASAYFNEIENHKDHGHNVNDFGEWHLVNIIYDLWTAGVENTSITLNWAILLMIKYPDVQAKVREELDRVLGTGLMPTMADHTRLPYTNAVIHEILRYTNILPGSFKQQVKHDTKVNGYYTLPAGTIVKPQFCVILQDDLLFHEANVFNPERFLDTDGKFKKCPYSVPFSMGKRKCPGESLAKILLFTVFSSTMKKFVFSIDPNEHILNLEPVFSFAMCPQQYMCQVLIRVI